MSTNDDRHHQTVEVEYVKLVWNSPKGPAADDTFATAWAEIDVYTFNPVSASSYNEAKIQNLYLQAAFNKFQKYRLKEVRCLYEGTNNTIASPATVTAGGELTLTPNAFAFQPYNCLMRYDENDVETIQNPGTPGTTLNCLNQLFLMEKEAGTLKFKSTDTATFKFTPATYSRVTTNQGDPNTVGGSDPNNSTVSVPTLAPWLPTKVRTGTAGGWTINNNILYHALKFGMYNLNIMHNWRWVAQGQQIIRIPLGVLRITEVYEFAMLDERNPISWPSWTTPTLLALQEYEDPTLRGPDGKQPDMFIEDKDKTEEEEKGQ